MYDENRVAAISANVAAAINAATLGVDTWDNVPSRLSSEFPGSFGALWNINFAESRLNFLSVKNIDPSFAKSFGDYYAYINPWSAYWKSVKSGTVTLSEEVFPARSFADTEFYNDWLRPQKDVEAAVGMKLVGDQRETVQLMMHFPVSLTEIYSKAAVEVLARVRGNLERSIDFARLMRKGAEGAVAGAALVERGRCAAFVLEADRLVREANGLALELFSAGQPVQVRNGRCVLNDREADARFAAALEALSAGIPTNESRISFRTATAAWQVTMAALPGTASSLPSLLSLLPPQQLVLVLVAELRLGSAMASSDLGALSTAFGLTPAEISFCRRLAIGESVVEASSQIGITVETARTRLKAILQKTGTSRQGQLMLLLSRLN